MAAHWNALLKSDKTKRITCIFFTGLIQTLVSLRTYKSAQMVEVLLLNRVPRSIVSDSKGLTAGKWVLSRGSLHSSSFCWQWQNCSSSLIALPAQLGVGRTPMLCLRLLQRVGCGYREKASLCNLLEGYVRVILEKRT